MDKLLAWHKFNDYIFVEDSHTYYFNGEKVETSVTKFVGQFFEKFDSDTISRKYALKRGLNQEEVLKEWDRTGKISSLSGTIVHSYLENIKRGKILPLDYTKAIEEGLCNEVKERVELLLPKARKFHAETLNKLFPIQMEYTVGLGTYLAGNIDLLCWNERAQEFQIWDYKNVQKMSVSNDFGKKAFYPFEKYFDCKLVHYSVQLNTYKYILQRVLNIPIGKCYLVHFDYQDTSDNFDIYECLDLQAECELAVKMHCDNIDKNNLKNIPQNS